VNFDFSPEEQKFADEAEQWLIENHDPVVMDHHRENFSQLADTPERRDFMKKLTAKGWLGMSWPKEYGGQEISLQVRVLEGPPSFLPAIGELRSVSILLRHTACDEGIETCLLDCSQRLEAAARTGLRLACESNRQARLRTRSGPIEPRS
jgi:hypothetical protein